MRDRSWGRSRWAGIVVAMFAVLALAGCDDDDDPAPPAPTVNGTVTFDFVPTSVVGEDVKLDYAKTTRLPARFVIVEAIDPASQAVLATAITDASGHYAFELPVKVDALIRAKAKMPKTAGNPLEVAVLDNTSGNAQWATTGAVFNSGATGAQTQDLNAGSGWTGAAYDDGQRAAGPFAILDTIYQAVAKVTSVDASAVFPALTVYWSPNNIAAGTGEDAAQIALGQINITHFVGADTDKGTGPALYVLGKADNDTDEYDRHVIAHEFGHYLQSAFSRDDNIGGEHEAGNLLDIRVAFSEGWGNGWSGIALNDPVYTDTIDKSQAKGDVFDVSAGAASNAGFFSEASVQKFFWDFDKETTIGFAGVWTALKTGLTTAPALTSIHSFAYALNAQIPSASAAIAAILATQAVVLPSDSYGTGELYFGVPEVQDLSPLYLVHPGVGQSLPNVCVNNAKADATPEGREINRAGEFRFLRIVGLPAGDRVITVTRAGSDAATSTPLLMLYDKTGEIAESDDKGVDTQSLAKTLAGGDYVLAVSDLKLKEAAANRSCFTVRID